MQWCECFTVSFQYMMLSESIFRNPNCKSLRSLRKKIAT